MTPNIPQDVTFNPILNTALHDAITNHQEDRKRLLQLYNRYRGKYNPLKKRAEEIRRRKRNKFVEDIFLAFVRDVVDARTGYFGSHVVLDSQPGQDWTDDYTAQQQDILRSYVNQVSLEYMTQKMIKDASLYGVAYKLLYINQKGQLDQLKLKPWEVIYEYDASLTDKPQTVIRYYKVHVNDSERWRIELYDATTVYFLLENAHGQFEADTTFTNQPMIRHGFSQLPIIRLQNNEDALGNVESSLDVMDNYAKIISDFSADLQAFSNAMLKIKNQGWSDQQEELVQNANVVLVTGENADAAWLTKDIAYQATEYFLGKLQSLIYRFSKVVDFQELGSGYRNLAEVKLRLLNFENDCSITENEVIDSIMQELSIVNELLPGFFDGVIDLDGVMINLNRNLPVNLKEELEAVSAGRGLLSKKTLLRQLSFIEDPEGELKALEEEYENSLFSPDEDIVDDTSSD